MGPPVPPTAPGVQLAEELSKDVPSQTSVAGSGTAQAGGDVAGDGPQVAQDAAGVQFEEIFPDAQWHQKGISEDNVHQPAAPSSAAQVAYATALPSWLASPSWQNAMHLYADKGPVAAAPCSMDPSTKPSHVSISMPSV